MISHDTQVSDIRALILSFGYQSCHSGTNLVIQALSCHSGTNLVIQALSCHSGTNLVIQALSCHSGTNLVIQALILSFEYYSNKELLKIRNIDKYDFKKRYNRDFSRKLWYFAILRGLLRISRFIAENIKFAIFRGKCQISRYRTHRDKYLPLFGGPLIQNHICYSERFR